VSGAEAVAGADFVNRKLPPVAEIAVVSMALVIIGGIFMAAHLPAHPPLGFAEVLLVLAGVVLVTNVVLLARLQDFAWASFFLVAKWSLLAYLVIAGILEYIFVFDGTRGQILVVMTCMLAVFAVNVPMLLAFSVARYQPVP
jgi:membrane-bound acyltransferase YfiQ involved in biofilm formation